jgi:hypothetical protein
MAVNPRSTKVLVLLDRVALAAVDSPHWTFPSHLVRRIMKTTYLFATLVAVALPLATITAEDSSKPEATPQKQEQNSDMMGMKGMMGKEQMMSYWKDQEAELDKLVAEMNSASADKKIEAVVTVLNKLVQQRKAMHEQMQKMASEKQGMCMCQ